MILTRYERVPKKAKTPDSLDAWFYAEREGITVYISTLPHGPTVHCRITKRQLRRYLAEMDGP